MYLLGVHGLGQSALPSTYSAPCLQDDVAARIASSRLSDHVYKNLDAFGFRSVAPRSWHRAWIRQQLVPAISKSFQTAKPITTILVIGDADEIGTPTANYQHGRARAQAVKREIELQLALAGYGQPGKVIIEAFSRGECSPVVRSGRREARNRRVEVFAMRGRLAAPRVSPPQPTPTLKLPNLLDLPERFRKEEEQRAFQRRLFAPLPPLPQGKSLEERLTDALRGVVSDRIRPRIVNAFLKGSCDAVAQLLAQASRSQAEQEAAKETCKAFAKVKMR